MIACHLSVDFIAMGFCTRTVDVCFISSCHKPLHQCRRDFQPLFILVGKNDFCLFLYKIKLHTRINIFSLFTSMFQWNWPKIGRYVPGYLLIIHTQKWTSLSEADCFWVFLLISVFQTENFTWGPKWPPKAWFRGQPLQNFDQDLGENLGEFLAGKIAEISPRSWRPKTRRDSCRRSRWDLKILSRFLLRSWWDLKISAAKIELKNSKLMVNHKAVKFKAENYSFHLGIIGLYFGNLGKKFVSFKIMARYRKSRNSPGDLPNLKSRRELDEIWETNKISIMARSQRSRRDSKTHKHHGEISTNLGEISVISARWRISRRDLGEI